MVFNHVFCFIVSSCELSAKLTKPIEETMTKLEKIYICAKCGERYQPSNNVNGIHSYFGLDCNGELIPHFSQSSLIELLKGKIEQHMLASKGDVMSSMSDNIFEQKMARELQSLLSMIEKGE